MKHHLFFIFNLLSAILGYAQGETDSLITSRRFIAPSLYLDYGKLLTILTKVETKYEGGVELLILEKFPMIIEVGRAVLSPEGVYSNGIYESQGMYYRIGTGYTGQFKPKNKIGLTVRYAVSTFDENEKIFIKSISGAQGDFIQVINQTGLSAQWWEVVLYSDKQLSNLFSIGLNLRLRILHSYDKQEYLDVYAIPGYGRTFDSTIPAVNFFLKVTF